MKGVKKTVDLEYTKLHYYGSHPSVNPRGIVPKGIKVDYDLPHKRDQVGKETGNNEEARGDGKCVCL